MGETHLVSQPTRDHKEVNQISLCGKSNLEHCNYQVNYSTNSTRVAQSYTKVLINYKKVPIIFKVFLDRLKEGNCPSFLDTQRQKQQPTST